MIRIESSLKKYTRDQDKALAPEETVSKAHAALQDSGCRVLEKLIRVDADRLGIPVYMSVCTDEAARIMPTAKQMGKGSSPKQAQASALMELVERYSFFRFWEKTDSPLSWSEAKSRFKEKLLPVQRIIKSTGEDIREEEAMALLDLASWKFSPCTDLTTENEYYVPADWFRMLNEFNGSSAGNTAMESILQGACELVERHVCAQISRERSVTPTIHPESLDGDELQDLYHRFTQNGIKLLLKDFSLGLSIPTVAAIAYDPETYPHKSEIVFTAGTATSPQKAALRALTETAQLAGDFQSEKIYEPSALPKLKSLQAMDWLQAGETVDLSSLPDISDPDMGTELYSLSRALEKSGYLLHTLDITCPDLRIPAHYSFVPGFSFRERSPSASMGMFIGKKIVQSFPLQEAGKKLDQLARIRPGAHYLPFQYGLLALQANQPEQAKKYFQKACALQKSPQEQALAFFYCGYALSLQENWTETKGWLQKAVALDDEVQEYHNLLGVALFKEKRFSQAARSFRKALSLDSASAMDMANLGLCYKVMGYPEEAMPLLSQAVEIDRGLEFAYRELLELLSADDT